MAKLHISEYGGIVHQGGVVPALSEPGITSQAITFTTSTQSAAFNANSRVIRIVSDTPCYLKFGSNPTATNDDIYLPAGQLDHFFIQPGDKVAVYDGTS